MSRRLLGSVACLLLAGLLAGCVRVPDNGPVVETRSRGEVNNTAGIFIDPRPPQPGDTPAEIVKGFLNAMQATPIQTRTAKQFLTKDAGASWNPQNATLTYDSNTLPRETPAGVVVTLTGAHRLDRRGAWQGALPHGRRVLRFPMTIEDDEWRIDQAPDALIVPETWFEQRYRQVSVYFFDPTASILEPEPVFVPRGEQLASTLTQALLMGPGAGEGRVAQSFLPPGLRIAVGVAVSDDGVADVQLNGDAGDLASQTVELMMAQLAWTLRQEPEIESLRVSINGEPVPLPGGVSSYRVDGAAEYDPAGFQASPNLFGLQGGRVITGTTDTGFDPVVGPFGEKDFGLRSIGVGLGGTRLAGVGAGGTSVLVGPLGEAGRVQTVVSGAVDLLRPRWDFADRIWLVDRAADGARVSYVEGRRVRSLLVPGITGERVRSFLVSRDGTRLVAAIRGPDGDALVVSRIEHSGTGRVVGATPAERIDGGNGIAPRIRAISWRSATSVAVLNPFTPALSKVGSASVDGSPSGTDPSASTVEGQLLDLAGSPALDEPLYGISTDGVVDIADRGLTPLGKGTTSIVYVG